MKIVKRIFDSSSDAILYAGEHVCVTLVSADTGVVTERGEYVAYELVEDES